jgi:hypothetical protein
VSKPDAAGWKLVETKSEMDGSPVVTLSLDAENNIEGWLESGRPQLVIRYMEGKTHTYVNAQMPANPELGRYQSYGVRIRVDNGTLPWLDSDRVQPSRPVL